MKAFAFALPLASERCQSRSFKQVRHPKDLCADVPCLWTDPQTQIIDLGDAGVVIGILFSRGSSARLKSLPSDAPYYADPESLAAWLICECWGAYVAILTGSEAGRVQVLVDPSGLFPAYGTQTAAHKLVVSQPDLIEQVSGRRPKPSWHDIQAHLGRSDLRQRSTCLERVREFGRGELTVLGEREAVGISLWSPVTFMPDSKSRSCAEVTEELQAITTMVVSAWANVLGPVAVAASGGVDSSMICAALAKTGQPFNCVTLATADPSGDESAYVEMLSRHLGVRSEVRIYDIEHIDPMHSVSTGLARPTRKPFMAALDTALFDAGQSLGAKVIFDGNGGDSLFCFLHSAVPVVDRLLSEGLGRGSVSTFLDMCRLTGCDLQTMTRAVFRRLVRKRGGSVWPPDLRLLAAGTEDFENIEPLSPWLDVSVARHPGKHDHLALILRNQNRLNGLASLPRFSPLMSQPMVEYCLSVPTWLWCAGGINRAPARAAFASDLPRDILVRTSKAGPDSFLWQFFETYRPIYRELLLDGMLTRNGLLDRDSVEQALKVDSTSASELIYRVFDLVEAENWARSWQG
jgi:asparagine synthase (glutamine-hydrolysing)